MRVTVFLRILKKTIIQWQTRTFNDKLFQISSSISQYKNKFRQMPRLCSQAPQIQGKQIRQN